MRWAFLGLLIVGCSGPPVDDDDSSPDPPPACEEQMFRGSPQRAGASPGELPAGAPSIAWSTNVFDEPVGGGETWWRGFPQADSFVDEIGPDEGGQIFLASSPLVCGDRLITAWRSGLVTAHDRFDGTLLWTFEADADFDGTPVVTPDRVYLGGTDGRVRALSTATGDEVWRQLLAADTLASAAWTEHGLTFGDKTGRVVALDPDDGAERWRIQRAKTVSSSPSYSGDEAALLLGEIGRVETSLTSAMFALDAATGDELWSVDADAQVLSTAAWHDGRWYVGSFDNQVYALTADGDVAWTFPTLANVSASPAVDDDRVYVGAWDWTLYAIDHATGAEAWSVPLGSDALASPVRAGTAVLQAVEDGRLFAVEAADGAVRWTFDRGTPVRTMATPTVAADGTIYVASPNGDLLALSE